MKTRFEIIENVITLKNLDGDYLAARKILKYRNKVESIRTI